VRGPVDHGRAGNEDTSLDPGLTQRLDQMMGPSDVDLERRQRAIPRAADMRRTGAMIDDRRPEPGDSGMDAARVEHIDRFPSQTRRVCRRHAPRSRPRDQVRGRTLSGEPLDEMTPGESTGPGDEGRPGHACRRPLQRGRPLIAPLNGEKFPRPASVNDRKNRWSDGILTVAYGL